jgi:hypothetical protein
MSQFGNSEYQNRETFKHILRLGEIIEPRRVNLVNGSTTDLTTAYNMASGTASFTYPIPIRSSYAIQASVVNLTGTLDATLDVYGSIDNNNWALIAPQATERITLSSTPSTSGWTKNLSNYDFIKVTLTINNCTGGSLTLLMVLK